MKRHSSNLNKDAQRSVRTQKGKQFKTNVQNTSVFSKNQEDRSGWQSVVAYICVGIRVFTCVCVCVCALETCVGD